MYVLSAHGQTRSDGARTGTGGHDGARAARTEGGDGDAPQEEGDTQNAASTRRHPDRYDTVHQSGADETPSGVHACIYTNTNVHQCPYSTVIRHAPAAAHSHIRSNASNRESRMYGEHAGALSRGQVAASTAAHSHTQRSDAAPPQKPRSTLPCKAL